ncbi:hypothetical protein MMC26_002663 [Xylographa opegraphella]|nr:hypothetical protein [Xylographa opegraphella]
MSSKRRRVSDRSGRPIAPFYYGAELKDIDLGHAPSTKSAELEDIDLGAAPHAKSGEPDLSPITEESRTGSSAMSTASYQAWSPTMDDGEVSSRDESSPVARASDAWNTRLPDNEYPAHPPTDWVSEVPFLVRDEELGRGTSPETFAETYVQEPGQAAQEQNVEEQVRNEYNRYLMSANIFAKRWEDSPQTPAWLASVEEEVALQLAGRTRPVSPRDYWQDAGPVRREHFDEYKELKARNERNLSKLFFRAGRKMQDLQKEVHRQQQMVEELEKLVDTLQARAVELEALGVKAQKMPDQRDSRTRRKPREKVYRNDYSSRHLRPRLTELPGTREFLFDDAYSQNVELVVEALLQRAYIMMKLADWAEMWEVANKAHQVARELQYQPLLQRCHFYIGVAAFGLRRLEQASDSLEWAAKCRNYYYEGELVAEWHIRTKKEERRRQAERSEAMRAAT